MVMIISSGLIGNLLGTRPSVPAPRALGARPEGGHSGGVGPAWKYVRWFLKFKIYDGTYLCLLSNYSEGGISKAVEAGDGEAIIFLQSGHGTAGSAGHAPGDTSIPALAQFAPAAGNLPGLPSLIVENCLPLLALTLFLASFQALVWDE